MTESKRDMRVKLATENLQHNAIYSRGKLQGIAWYPAHPGFDIAVGLQHQHIVKAADQLFSSESSNPLTLFSSYRDGFISGYSEAKERAENKEE